MYNQFYQEVTKNIYTRRSLSAWTLTKALPMQGFHWATRQTAQERVTSHSK